MNNTNPFESPTVEVTHGASSSKAISTGMYSLIGGAIGLFLGLTGILTLFLNSSGVPGVLEILLLVSVTTLLFVLPGAAIGAVTCLLVNRSKSIS